MTDEELKNKCTERAKIFQQAMESCRSSSPIDCIEWFADRIAELEKENEIFMKANKIIAQQRDDRDKDISKLEERNIELIDKVMKLKAQIEEMKCCANCKHSRTEYEHCKTNKHEKWEIKEK